MRPLAFFFLALTSCGGLAAQMHASSTTSCTEVLRHEGAIRSDPRYAQQPAQDRAAYELDVADCDLEAGKAQAALDLADAWHDAVAVRRDQLRVRALATLNQPDALREALGTLAGETDLTAEYFANTAELGAFEASDWLVPMAVQAWKRRPGPFSLRQFARTLVHNAGGHLVHLAVVSADPGRAPGEWAVWTGKVHDARLDRAGNRTVLQAEGIDINDQASEDKVVTSVQGNYIEGRWGHVGVGHVEMTPKYTTEVTHHDVLAANGKAFFVRFARIDEHLVQIGMFTAFGRYAGRDGADGPPVLDAVIIVDEPLPTN
jgi:hypothetical protein